MPGGDAEPCASSVPSSASDERRAPAPEEAAVGVAAEVVDAEPELARTAARTGMPTRLRGRAGRTTGRRGPRATTSDGRGRRRPSRRRQRWARAATRRPRHQRRPQARVERDREDVGDEVGDDVHGGDDQRERLDDRDVAAEIARTRPRPCPGSRTGTRRSRRRRRASRRAGERLQRRPEGVGQRRGAGSRDAPAGPSGAPSPRSRRRAPRSRRRGSSAPCRRSAASASVTTGSTSVVNDTSSETAGRMGQTHAEEQRQEAPSANSGSAVNTSMSVCELSSKTRAAHHAVACRSTARAVSAAPSWRAAGCRCSSAAARSGPTRGSRSPAGTRDVERDALDHRVPKSAWRNPPASRRSARGPGDRGPSRT